MTNAQYRATQRLYGNRMSKRDTDILVNMLNTKTDPHYKIITLAVYIRDNPDRIVKRWTSKRGIELIQLVNPYGDTRTYELRRADTQTFSIYAEV